MSSAPPTLTPETAAGFWALPPGISSARILTNGCPGIETVTAPRDYDIRLETETKTRKVPLGAAIWGYRFLDGLPRLNAAYPNRAFGVSITLKEIQSNGTVMPMRIGNVNSDGEICWGPDNTNPVSNPRKAWETFWVSPFNNHLVDGFTPGQIPQERKAEYALAVSAAIEALNAPLPSADKPWIPGPAEFAPPQVPEAQNPRFRFNRMERTHALRVGKVRPLRNADLYVRLLEIESTLSRAYSRVENYSAYMGTAFDMHLEGRLQPAHDYTASANLWRLRALEICPVRYHGWLNARFAYVLRRAFIEHSNPREIDAIRVRLRREFSEGSTERFYGGGWRSNCYAAKLERGAGVDISPKATHALMSADPGLVTLIPAAYRINLGGYSAQICPHPGCAVCKTSRYSAIGFAFKAPSGYLTMVMDPNGILPPLRFRWSEGQWFRVGSRGIARDSENQKRRDHRHILRMKVLSDPILAGALAVTLTRRRPVQAQTVEANA